jgi:hypothetical protein
MVFPNLYLGETSLGQAGPLKGRIHRYHMFERGFLQLPLPIEICVLAQTSGAAIVLDALAAGLSILDDLRPLRHPEPCCYYSCIHAHDSILVEKVVQLIQLSQPMME